MKAATIGTDKLTVSEFDMPYPQVIVQRRVENVSVRSSRDDGAYVWITEDNKDMVIEAIKPNDGARVVVRVPRDVFAEFARACVELSENMVR